MNNQKILLEKFLLLSNKKINAQKTATKKEELQNQYIDLFFNSNFEELKEQENKWQQDNDIINDFNQVFLNTDKINNLLITNKEYNIIKNDNSLIQLYFEPKFNIINTIFTDNITIKDNIIKITQSKYLKNDTQDTKQLKDNWNNIFNKIKSTKSLSNVIEIDEIFSLKYKENKNSNILNIAIILNNHIVDEKYKSFIKINKTTLELKQQKSIKNPFINNENYYLMKIKEESSANPFIKYKFFKEIYIYFRNLIASKDETITYTPNDLAEFSSKLLYELLLKLEYFNNKNIVFADLFCGSGNLAMSFIKELEINKKSHLLKWIYLNDEIENNRIGSILQEYLLPLWNEVPNNPISNIKISTTDFITLIDEGDDFGFGSTTVKPNVILSNPDFKKDFVTYQKTIQEFSDENTVFFYFFNKELENIEGFKKIVVKLDNQSLFLNTSSILYLNIYLSEDIVKKYPIKTKFINIPDSKQYFSQYNSNIWKDKKKSINLSLVDTVMDLIFNQTIDDYYFNCDNNYFILNDKILLDGKENDKQISIEDDKIFIDKNKEVYFKTNLNKKYVTIDTNNDTIYYISSDNDINYFKIPSYNGKINNILNKKYEELKKLL